MNSSALSLESGIEKYDYNVGLGQPIQRYSTSDLSARMQTAAVEAEDAIIQIDAYGHIIQCTHSIERLFGRSWASLAGVSWLSLIAREQHAIIHRAIHHPSFAVGQWRIAYLEGAPLLGQHADGQRFPIEIIAQDEGCDGLGLRNLALYRRSSSKRPPLIHHTEQSQTSGSADIVLGRSALLDQLTRVMRQHRRGSRSFALLAIAIADDSQKSSSQLLGQCAERLNAVRRQQDIIARFDPQTLVLVLENVFGARALERIVKRISNSLTESVECDGLSLRPVVSIGSACYPEDAIDPEAMLECAESQVISNPPLLKGGFREERGDCFSEVA